MEMHFTGIIIAAITFLIIGLFHPIVIKTEYYFGTKPWWMFLLVGICAICLAIYTADILISASLGVLGASSLWAIGELFDQKKRVEKGWFPMNPKRKTDYKKEEKLVMKTELILVGKTVNKHFNAGINDYVERIGHYMPFSITTIPELKNTKNLSESQQKD